MLKPLSENLPYPQISNIKPSVKDATLLSTAYADNHGELTAILQYVYQAITANAQGNIELSQTLLSIAFSEMTHLRLIGDALIRLGVSPVFSRRPPNRCDFYSSSSIDYSSSLATMIATDIADETDAIRVYEYILVKLNDPMVIDLVSRIVLDEKLHLSTLKTAYRNIVGGSELNK